jgi:cell division protease FtsH
MEPDAVETTTGPVTIDLDVVRDRMDRLAAARASLKAHFVGIDRVVDELCDAVTVWFTMPEVLTRPVIVNLWGMTGVGKTDLVRRLVRALDASDRFVEIELSNGDSTTYTTSVAARLQDSAALRGRPAILLFDEIQRFNTLDADGRPLANTKFSDFWELLSDGRLSRRESVDVDWLVAEMVHARRMRERDRPADGTPNGYDEIGIWEARNLQRSFGLADDVGELATLSHDEALRRMTEARSTKRVFEPIDATKCLIIVSGNLDEAFTMATESAEADVDADIFHAFTSKITMVDVKRALMQRFKPEQVARFGNVHLVYTSLRRADFETLIDREVERVCQHTRGLFGIDVTISPAVRRLVYRNGVFPVAGVRPVFSSIGDIVETNLAKLVFEAVVGRDTTIDLDYDESARALVSQVGTRSIRIPYSGRVDAIRLDTLPDQVANVAVHEAGHAVAYGLLFGLAPLQLTARVANSYVGGFTFPHQIYQTAESVLHQVEVLLAGGLAEEIVFGGERASIGRNADRERATELIIDFVRRYGFDREFQANYMLDFAYAMDRSVPEPDIEKMMTRLVAETKQLLSEHRALLVELGLVLADRGRLGAAEVAATMRDAGVAVEVRPEGFQWMPDYHHRLHG